MRVGPDLRRTLGREAYCGGPRSVESWPVPLRVPPKARVATASGASFRRRPVLSGTVDATPGGDDVRWFMNGP